MAVEIGNKFGALVAVRPIKSIRYGGKNTRLWLCRCGLCEREEELPETVLGRRKCCIVCHRGPCVVCGNQITRTTRSNTCSDACQILKRRGQWNKHYAKQSEELPDYQQQRYAAHKQRIAENPEYARIRKEQMRNANQQRNQLPHVKRRNAEYRARYYQENREQIQNRRTEFWQGLTEDQREERRQRRRDQDNDRTPERWEQISSNPERLAEHNAKMRHYYRDRKKSQALAGLREAADKLQRKLDEHTDQND